MGGREDASAPKKGGGGGSGGTSGGTVVNERSSITGGRQLQRGRLLPKIARKGAERGGQCTFCKGKERTKSGPHYTLTHLQKPKSKRRVASATMSNRTQRKKKIQTIQKEKIKNKKQRNE